MTNLPVHTALLDKVLRLTVALTDRVVEARAMGSSVPDEQRVALMRSAQILQDHGVDWPPMLAQALSDPSEGSDEDEPREEMPQMARDEMVMNEQA